MIRTGFTLSRAPRTKKTLPDFHEWCRVIRHPQIFRGLTSCQRTPRFWGVTGWKTYFSEYIFDIDIIQSDKNIAADFLTRDGSKEQKAKD